MDITRKLFDCEIALPMLPVFMRIIDQERIENTRRMASTKRTTGPASANNEKKPVLEENMSYISLLFMESSYVQGKEKRKCTT
jgi:hypothetical protein